MKFYRLIFCLCFLPAIVFSQTSDSSDTRDVVRALQIEAFGKLDPSIMQVMTDSGSMKAGVKNGTWREYRFMRCILESECDYEKLQYDTLLNVEASGGNITFYRFRGNYVNGLREGLWRSYSTYRLSHPFEWALDDEVNYVKGKMEGWRTQYNEGKIFIRTFYTKGVIDSVRLVYHKGGQLSMIQRYKNDIPTGSTEEYFESGQIDKEYILEGGQIVNIFLFKSDGYFLKNGKKEGKFKVYSADEKLMVEGEYINDQTEGIMKFYNEDGKVVCVQHQKRGKSDGLYTWYHDNGKIWTELMMKDGKTIEVISNYSSDGKTMPKGTLKNGTGTVIRYDEKGKQIAVDHYKDGVEVGNP